MISYACCENNISTSRILNDDETFIICENLIYIYIYTLRRNTSNFSNYVRCEIYMKGIEKKIFRLNFIIQMHTV